MLKVWMSHGDKVTQLPPGFKLMASSDVLSDRRHGRRGHASFYGAAIPSRRLPTPSRVRRHAASALCNDYMRLQGTDWNMPDYVTEAVERRFVQQVGTDEVILGLSGGVDSSVAAAALIHQAQSVRSTDLRVSLTTACCASMKPNMVMATFAKNLGVKVIHVDATDRVHGHAGGRRRSGGRSAKIIGKEFVEVFQR